MITSEKKVKFAIVSIIFLLGMFFGLNFSNFNGDFQIETLPTEESAITVETNFDAIQQEQSFFQRDSFGEKYSMQELITFALDEINADRLENGVTPVKLGNNHSAQIHVDDMMTFEYFSHWNTSGVKPYVTYTEYGGRAYVKENIAASWCEGFDCEMEPFELIEKFQYLMVYDDAKSNWGHRDNILDPNHTLVNIGIAWDNNNFYYAQHFETKLIDFNQVNLSNDNILRLFGEIQDGYNLKSITIFQDDMSISLDGYDLESNSPYNQNFYDSGKLTGVLVKKAPLFEFYEECQKDRILISSNSEEWCIPYETFENESENNSFEITVDVSKLLDVNSIHTIYINLENQNGDHVIGSSITLEYL